MPSALSAIHRFLDGLIQRERSLLLAAVVARGFAVGLGSLVFGAAWLSLGRPALETLVLGGLFVATAVAGLVAWPVWKRWGGSGTRIHQARQVEAAVPDFHHLLITVIGRADLLGTSPRPVLLERAAVQVARRLEAVEPQDIHPSTEALRSAAVALALLLMVGLAQLTLPVGPIQALAAVSGQPSALVPESLPTPTDADDRALVGDIVLRYVFPDHTGIDPVEVANSDGTIHAPVGTTVQIRARTAEVFQSAALQINEGELLAADLLAGRDILAELVIGQPGVWRFWLSSGDQRIPTKDFKLVVEEDAAPVVTLESGGSPAVPHNRPIPLGWNARDDFGIQRVVVEVTQGDETREVELRAPLDSPRDLRGSLGVSPRDLGLKPGESAKLKVVAYDNDHAGGNKRGESSEFEVTALGPRGRGQHLSRQLEALRDAMLPVLARFLVEEVPPGETIAAMQRWSGSTRDLYDPIRDLVEESGGLQQGTLQGDLVGEVLESGARLVRFSVTTWDPSTTRRITAGDYQRFADLHGEAVVALEKGIYVIDSLLVSAAMAEVASAAEDLAAEAQDLASRAQDMEAAEILARLDKLNRTMASLARKAEKVNEGALQEYLNGRLDDTANLMEQIREAVAEGRLDDARDLLEQLAEQVQQMAEGINDRMASSQSREDQLGDAAKKAMDELQKLEEDQRALADELEKQRDELGQQFSEQLELWRKLDSLASEGAERGRSAVESTGDGRGWRVESVRRLEVLNERTGGIADAVRARDLDRIALRSVEMERNRARMDDSLPGGLENASADAQRVREVLDEMLEVLANLEERQQADDPRMQEAAKEMATRQDELQQRQQKLQKDIQQIERAMPTGDGEATEAMQRAGEAMERAESSLDRGEAMAGEGHQREAAERVSEAREQLQQQMQQMQQMQQTRGQMQGQQQGEPQPDENNGDESERQAAPIDIPSPEDFQTPEEYRRALLEGMAGDVPEEYRAMKQQYFEELVRQ